MAWDDRAWERVSVGSNTVINRSDPNNVRVVSFYKKMLVPRGSGTPLIEAHMEGFDLNLVVDGLLEFYPEIIARKAKMTVLNVPALYHACLPLPAGCTELMVHEKGCIEVGP